MLVKVGMGEAKKENDLAFAFHSTVWYFMVFL